MSTAGRPSDRPPDETDLQLLLSRQIWSSGAAQEAEPGDAVLENHSSWGAVADLRVVLLNPNHEVGGDRPPEP